MKIQKTDIYDKSKQKVKIFYVGKQKVKTFYVGKPMATGIAHNSHILTLYNVRKVI